MKNNDKDNDILKGWRDFKAGRVKLRTWTVNKRTRERKLSYTGIEDLRKKRAETLRTLRAEGLKLSQAEFARAIHVSVRTLQGWETGRSLVPGPVMILLKVLKKHPKIKKELAEA